MADNPNIVQLTANPKPLGSVPAPATGAPRNSAEMRAMAQALLDYIAGGIYTATPTGTVAAFAGNAAPDGWLLCDGRAVSRATYANLFGVLGVRYGAGDAATTFNLPDLRGRGVIGAGQGPNLTNRPLAGMGGEEAHSLTIQEMPAHSHSLPQGTIYAGTNDGLPDDSQNAGAPGVRDSGSTGGNAAHNNMQPYLALNYIVRV